MRSPGTARPEHPGQECKQERELERLTQKSPRRYSRDEGGRWRCPPGEAYAAPFGLYYRLRSSVEINWTLQRNIQYLEDYWRFDSCGVASEIREIVQGEIAAAPGLHLSGLLRNLHGVANRDDINRLIAAGNIYVDLRAAGVMEPDKIRVFPSRAAALACRHIEDHPGYRDYPRFIPLALGSCVMLDGKIWSIADLGARTIKLHSTDSTPTELPLELFQALVTDGRVEPAGVRLPEMKISSALGAASEDDLKIANQRFELVDRYVNRQLGTDQISVPKRTLRLWVASYKRAEAQYGSGYVGLIPKTKLRGNHGSKLPAESRTLLNDYVKQNYETVKQKSKFSVWAALLDACEQKGIVAPSYATFCSAVKRRPAFESILKRQGRRAAYTHEPFYWELERSTPRHGDRPFEIAHIDHTELDVELVCSHTGRILGRPWMTLFTDAFSRRCLALCLAFDAPSYRSCMMALRDCVRRHGRLPQIVVVDGGPEFQSTYFEALLARYECIKKTRPPAKARFGSCCERLFGTTNTRFIHNLQGNTQITRNIRQVTKSVDPRELSLWALAELHRRISEFLFEVYDTVDHPALGESPREVFRRGIEASGIRAERMIPYDQEFLISTLPTTARGRAKVLPGRGVIINHIYYWSSCFQAPGVENQQVPIRYDPFDAGTAYAFLEGRWVRCHSEYYTILNGHSEKELMIASNEPRKRQQRHSQGLAITAKRLAGFLQCIEADELLMAQRLRDREAQATRSSLSVVPSMPSSVGGDSEFLEENAAAANAETMDSGEIYGEF